MLVLGFNFDGFVRLEPRSVVVNGDEVLVWLELAATEQLEPLLPRKRSYSGWTFHLEGRLPEVAQALVLVVLRSVCQYRLPVLLLGRVEVAFGLFGL